MSGRNDHRRRDRPARASVFVDSSIRQVLEAAESPLKRADLHAQLAKLDPVPLPYMIECLEVLVKRGKILRIGIGDGATYWLRTRELKVSRTHFTTRVQG